MNELFKLLLYTAAVIILIGIIIILSFLFGERHKERSTGEPYESGIPATGSARIHLSNKFYITAIFFVIFDLEVIFLAAWAISLRETGWSGYIAILIFSAILITALIYEWRIGALDFALRGRDIIKALRKLNGE